MKTVAIIVAAGEGKRISSVHPKQYVCLGEKPILAYTLDKFEKCDLIDEIVLVVSPMYLDFCRQEVVEKFNFYKIRKMVIGGEKNFNFFYISLKPIEQFSPLTR